MNFKRYNNVLYRYRYRFRYERITVIIEINNHLKVNSIV
jgi:hypothetical protein